MGMFPGADGKRWGRFYFRKLIPIKASINFSPSKRRTLSQPQVFTAA